MAFGFPAYHVAVEQNARPVPELHQIICARVAELNWKIVLDHGHTVHITSSMGIWSWGEKVTVRFEPGRITVRSQCALFTQCIDWGKNRRNVESLMSALPPSISPDLQLESAGGSVSSVAAPSLKV